MPTDTWVCPGGVTSIFAEGWGSGSKGGGAALGTGNSGGGGAYARSVRFSVTPGTGYPVQWGPGDTNVVTSFDAAADMKAAPCVDAIPGAAAADCVGTVKHSGGNGIIGQYTDIDHPLTSSGGGGSGGRAADGTAGTRPTGGAAVAGGGAGGDGGTPGPPSQNPSVGGNGNDAGPGPGGGGGGCGWNIFGGGTGGHGASGGIYIWDATHETDFAIVSMNPALIVGTFGSVPPAPPPIVNPKAARRAFVM